MALLEMSTEPHLHAKPQPNKGLCMHARIIDIEHIVLWNRKNRLKKPRDSGISSLVPSAIGALFRYNILHEFFVSATLSSNMRFATKRSLMTMRIVLTAAGPRSDKIARWHRDIVVQGRVKLRVLWLERGIQKSLRECYNR